MQTELKAVFDGQVQGVFFRSSVKKYAEALAISGYAKNLPNGSVEIKAIGEKKVLDAFLAQIVQKPGFGNIEAMKAVYFEPQESFSAFLIL